LGEVKGKKRGKQTEKKRTNRGKSNCSTKNVFFINRGRIGEIEDIKG